MCLRGLLYAHVMHLKSSLLHVRAEQRAIQTELEDALACEVDALADLNASRDRQCRCRNRVDGCAQVISAMQDEIANLLPKQAR